MQPEYQTIGQMHERLLAMIRSRRDIGFRIAVAGAMLEPRNPFEPATKRRPKLAVAVAASMTLLFVAVFAYFSLHSGR